MLRESVCFLETFASDNISPTMYNKEEEQSQKEKSARKGTGSPFPLAGK